MNWLIIEEKIVDWLKEDMNNGDVTTDSLIMQEAVSSGKFLAKEAGVIAGLEVMQRVFAILDPEIVFTAQIKDGERLKIGDVFALIQGNTGNILKGERLALNLLQRMSGIATETAKYVECLQGLDTKLVDTRKTMPGLRIFDKYAVRVGGGYNHRFNLSEGLLIKDNHIKACGSISLAVAKAKQTIPHTMKIEVEVETLAQLEEALHAGAEIILLDNMDCATMRAAVLQNQGRALLEASGNINLTNVRQIAETGVNLLSVGALTHSVKALDLSLRLV